MRPTFICATVALASLAFVSGCREHYDPTVWREEFRSPDGAWTAVAHTEQYRGFGTAWVVSCVALQRPDKTYNKGGRFEVLDLEPVGIIPATYQLSAANRGGGADLKVRWTGPRNLELSYDGQSKITLQVVRFGDVRISLLNNTTHQAEL